MSTKKRKKQFVICNNFLRLMMIIIFNTFHSFYYWFCYNLGFGRSSRPVFSNKAQEAEDQLVRSIEEWRREMQLEKFVLLGHSMGGFLAASYSIQHPERIKHLILADPWGFPERPVEPASRPPIPLWVKAIAYVVQPLNPLWAVRVAGPFG